MINNYLTSAKKQFAYYKMLGERTFEQLADDELHWQFNPETNSVAIIVNHLLGNMKSRWTDFLTSDGEKAWRNRDAEFEDEITSRAELLERWQQGWQCLFRALNSVNESNFNTQVYIRNAEHTVTEAINRQLSHYAYHVGQIVMIGKMLRGSDWQPLSIPKNQSQEYNDRKFSASPRPEHFTQEFLDGTFYDQQ